MCDKRGNNPSRPMPHVRFHQGLSSTLHPSLFNPRHQAHTQTSYNQKSKMSSEPNVNFGAPIIFFDSHPEEQESYIYSYWSSLKSNLKIAWTGEVPKFHEPGKLRIIWWTHDVSRNANDREQLLIPPTIGQSRSERL